MSFLKSKKTPNATSKTTPTGSTNTAGGASLTLPTASAPSDNFLDYNWTIHGEKGIGKSTLSQQFADVVAHFLLEPGRRDLKGIILPKPGEKPTWVLVQRYIKLLIDKHKPGRINFDTIDQLANLCMSFWAAKKNVTTIMGINDHGRSWDELKSDWSNTMNSLFWAGWRVTFLSHSRYRPKINRSIPREEMQAAIDSGLVEPEIQPTCAGWAYEYLKIPCAFAGYYGYQGHERILHIRGSGNVYAASSLDNHFLQPKSSKNRPNQPLHALPMGTNPKQSYANLLKAWDNKLEGYFTDEEES